MAGFQNLVIPRIVDYSQQSGINANTEATRQLTDDNLVPSNSDLADISSGININTEATRQLAETNLDAPVSTAVTDYSQQSGINANTESVRQTVDQNLDVAVSSISTNYSQQSGINTNTEATRQIVEMNELSSASSGSLNLSSVQTLHSYTTPKKMKMEGYIYLSGLNVAAYDIPLYGTIKGAPTDIVSASKTADFSTFWREVSWGTVPANTVVDLNIGPSPEGETSVTMESGIYKIKE